MDSFTGVVGFKCKKCLSDTCLNEGVVEKVYFALGDVGKL